MFNDPEDSEKESDLLAPWTTVLSNDHIDEAFLYKSPDGEWVPFEHNTKVTNIVASTKYFILEIDAVLTVASDIGGDPTSSSCC